MLVSDRADAFDWVDDYFAHVRPLFEVRQADSLLIVMPNRAVKLNRSGLRTLQWLKQGGGIDDFLAKLGPQSQRRQELFVFLCDFRSLLTGCLGEGQRRRAVESAPHPEPFNALPVLSEVAVTYRCNLRCQFCYAACGCQRTAATSPEVSTRHLRRVLKAIRHEAQVPSVSLTGGEPLLRTDIEELVAAAVNLGLRVNLITNGTLLAAQDRAQRLRTAGLSSAQVSLEGPTAAVHDGLTCIPGSFARTIEGLQALARVGVHVHTNTTVNAANAPHLPALVRLVAGLGMKRLSMNLVIPAGQAANLDLQVAYRDVWSVIAPARDEARAAGVEFMWYSPTPMCILNPLAEGLGNKSCAACDGLLSVAPNGDVLPCSSYAQPVGNLLRQPFAAVWGSAAAVFFRRKAYAPTECSGCREFTACAGACPLYWSAMGTGELAGHGRMSHAVA